MILVTGGAGYVGSVLVPRLVEEGHKVRVVDLGLFGMEHIEDYAEVVKGDITEVNSKWFHGVEAIIHLASLSNDPMAQFSPATNFMVNAAGALILAHAARARGIEKFVMASTCSVYGSSPTYEAEEHNEYFPRPAYAVSKIMAERGLRCLAEPGVFRPIMLRKGTIGGWSPRMRFDLAINAMTKSALTKGEITVNNASIWRPLVDIQDVATAYLKALEFPRSGAYNIIERNYQVGEMAETVKRTLVAEGWDVDIVTYQKYEARNYRASSLLAKRELDFEALRPIRASVLSILDQFPTDYNDPKYYNIEVWKRYVRG